MAAIQKKDVNPTVILLANLCGFGVLGYILMGQMNKAIYVFAVTFVLSLLGGIGTIVAILAVIDGYQVAQTLAEGKEVDENEYKFELLFKLMSLLDKKAIFNG